LYEDLSNLYTPTLKIPINGIYTSKERRTGTTSTQRIQKTGTSAAIIGYFYARTRFSLIPVAANPLSDPT